MITYEDKIMKSMCRVPVGYIKYNIITTHVVIGILKYIILFFIVVLSSHHFLFYLYKWYVARKFG